ncbi:hypothetical protein H0H81_001201 [Sphagnurus paluster]|uniref:Uncharacterized protein n=1 Tax=Sphagnurus paluster TaxID=117069 RepID=A0A9P7FMJ5_9AGAR|nr:hypothetical protein H0H81_001201 [Sphagnurus paluster]
MHLGTQVTTPLPTPVCYLYDCTHTVGVVLYCLLTRAPGHVQMFSLLSHGPVSLLRALADVHDQYLRDYNLPITEAELNRDTVPGPKIAAELCKGKLQEAPIVDAAQDALNDFMRELKGPSRGKSGGYHAPEHDPFVWFQLEGIHMFLSLYTNSGSVTCGKWAASSFQAAIGLGKGWYCAQQLCHLACGYVQSCEVLPINPYGDWNKSMLLNETLVNTINAYLLKLGKEITAEKLVLFLAKPEVMEEHGIT